MLEWWEREHDLDDALAFGDDIMVNVLQECGLYKFFMWSNMWSQPLLLQHLVDMWDPDVGHFMAGDQILWLQKKDVYFLTELSCRVVTYVLVGGRRESSDQVVLCNISGRVHIRAVIRC